MSKENPKSKDKISNQSDATKFSYERPKPDTNPPDIPPISLVPPEPPKPKPVQTNPPKNNQEK